MSLRIGLLSLEALPSEREALEERILSLPFGEGERLRLSRLRNPSALRQSVGGLLTLDMLLRESEIPPQPILRTSLGKPYVDDPSFPCFSMTHTRGYAAAVLGEASSAQVGIDMEQVSTARSHQKIAKRFFTGEEQRCFWEGGESPDVFYRLWTKKEALAKLHGRGLFADTPISVYTVSFRLQIGAEIYYLTVAAENAPAAIRWNHQIKELIIHEVQN